MPRDSLDELIAVCEQDYEKIHPVPWLAVWPLASTKRQRKSKHFQVLFQHRLWKLPPCLHASTWSFLSSDNGGGALSNLSTQSCEGGHPVAIEKLESCVVRRAPRASCIHQWVHSLIQSSVRPFNHECIRFVQSFNHPVIIPVIQTPAGWRANSSRRNHPDPWDAK